MSYICQSPEAKLTSFEMEKGQNALVGDGECVALVKVWCGAPETARWRQGQIVKGSSNITPGTAIATFVNGTYQNNIGGNHAAIFLKNTDSGILVIDQWKTRSDGVGMRIIRFNRKATVSDSDNGDKFYVIQ